MPEVTSQRSYALAGVTGTVGAALAQDSIVFALLVDPASALSAYLEQLRLSFVAIVAFTTPITAGRRLGVYRATGVAATGGTALNVVKKKGASSPASVVTSARIAAAAALGVAGIVRDADPILVADLVHVGAAGGRAEFAYEFTGTKNTPHEVRPGELLVVSNPVAMDAAGTWQLGVNAHWREHLVGH
jgi:hypothetical protein